MKFIYPKELVYPIIDAWERYLSNFKKRMQIDEIPSPSPEHLETILDVLYHVSFLTEESRKTSVKVAYFEPINSNLDRLFNHYEQPIKFDKAIQYNVTEVLRLSPALNPENTILIVGPENCIDAHSKSNELVIWGILYLGNDYINLLKGRSGGAFSPPSILIIGASAPGSLTISTGGRILCRLNNGRLMEASLSGLDQGIIGSYFSDEINILYQETCKQLGTDKYSEEDDFDQHPSQLYFRTLTNIIRLTKEKFHGGTFLIVPSQLASESDILSDSLNIKYSIKSPIIWNTIINESIARKKYFELFFKAAKTVEDFNKQIRSDNIKQRSEEKIFEFEEFVASLTGVDGAVLLNTKLEILGFGTEITLSTPEVEYIKEAKDANGETFTEIPINSFGTRHRSAIRFCSKIENSIAIVISQDGSVKAIKKVENSLYLWNNIDVGEFGL
ncbi:TPA: DNA integrity scanning protein DisA nucleotide-binding domain protein [Bacillus cereus]|nr:DNA integrity scanning protein DisA nucleotide-binding domain protein [Bacillus cereus]